MSTRRAVADWMMLLLLAALWGTSFSFIKVAVGSLPPATVAAGRVLLAALILGAVTLAQRPVWPPLGRDWVMLAGLGLSGNALPFFAISWAEQRVSSAVAGILMAVMPLLTLVFAHFWVEGERLTAPKALGFSLGFVGILVLTGVEALRGSGSLPGQLAVLGGALCYAVNAILARRVSGLPTMVLSVGGLAVASCLLVPIAVVADHGAWAHATLGSLAALAWLGVVPTALATVVFFRLIASAGPTFFSQINYLIPLVALGVGMLLMGESVSGRALGALGLVLGGMWVGQRGG